MKWSAECCVVIPCLNEAREIGAVVAAARRFLPSILVIDDGSMDRTARAARKAGAAVITHARPFGKGEALGTGFRAAQSRGFSWALAMDGDGQHRADDIPAFLREAGLGGRMVIGNRMADPASMPWVRRAVNRWMSRALGDFCGQPAPDSQCGFRLVHLPSWESLRFTSRRFEVESELLVRFAAAGFPIRWVPVRTRYAGEQSKIRPLRDTLRWFRWWVAIRRELGTSPAAWKRPVLSHDAA